MKFTFIILITLFAFSGCKRRSSGYGGPRYQDRYYKSDHYQSEHYAGDHNN